MSQSDQPSNAPAPSEAKDAAAAGKRLLIYGMFSLVVVTAVTVFLSLWLVAAPMNMQAIAIRTTVIVTVVAIIACVIVWFVYTKVFLKE